MLDPGHYVCVHLSPDCCCERYNDHIDTVIELPHCALTLLNALLIALLIARLIALLIARRARLMRLVPLGSLQRKGCKRRRRGCGCCTLDTCQPAVCAQVDESADRKGGGASAASKFNLPEQGC